MPRSRSLHALLCAAAVFLAASPARTAGIDVAAQEKILKTSADFRFRVDACLKLGSSGDFKARKPLEAALDDPHPTVRQAAASALAKLGDALAIAALEARQGKEQNAPTLAAVESAINTLKTAGGGATSGSAGAGSKAMASAPPDWKSTKYVVKLQKVTNGSGVRGEQLAAVFEASTRNKLRDIPGVYVLPGDSTATAMLAQATTKGIPVLGIDAKVVLLDQANFAGDVKIQAKVAYAITKVMVIKSAIEGNASSIGSASSAKNPSSLVKLQDMAVDGAVASAMGKAPTALAAAAK
jgi:hypothetical protein